MLEIFMPKISGVLVQRVLFGTKFLVLFATITLAEVCCPRCQTLSQRVHSYYTRRITDINWADFNVQFLLEVRRFYCSNPNCPKRTFAERLGEAIGFYARRTQRLTAQLQALGLALGGNAGSHTAKKLGLAVSPDTLLNLVRQQNLPQLAPTGEKVKVKVLGVDEFAFRRGQTYGTILVDLELQRVLELLPDLNKDKLVAWLKAHPEIEVISRDRAGIFAQAGGLGVPQALQVADRFHVAQNLWEACENLVREQYPALVQALTQAENATQAQAQEPALLDQPTSPALAPPVVRERPHSPNARQPTRLAELKELDRKERKKQLIFEQKDALYQEVKRLAEGGSSPTQITQELGLTLAQVKRHLKGPPKILSGVGGKSKLEPYKAYLQKRCNVVDHFDNAKALWREIKQQGYDGGATIAFVFI